ncbi:MAG TPA: GIY-YIG nuclease family protein [Flavitalea sp.]|nr:GIY-YIG nuclease family protein [Flavitalea sp.]
MKVSKTNHYSVYIVTNHDRKVLYTGVTNDLAQRLIEHWINRGSPKTFAWKYYCFNLIYYEDYPYIKDAIVREKEIKGWSRYKKIELINSMNSNWVFLNASICDGWPPKETPTRF